MASEAIKQAIETVAAEPMRARDQAIDVQHHNLKDLIAADKHLCGKAVARNPLAAIRRAAIAFGRPGGVG